MHSVGRWTEPWGGSEIPMNRAQGLCAESERILASFTWAIIHETFSLTTLFETEVCFQALARVILVPNSMKCISLRLHLEIIGICEFSSVTSGDQGISQLMTPLMRLKILLQKDLNLGHSHHIWTNVPNDWHPLKHRGSAEG